MRKKYRAETLYISKDYDTTIIPMKQHNEGRFGLGWDCTDHFSFYCLDCKYVAEVLYASTYRGIPGIWLWLVCPKCGKENARKIYFEGAKLVARDLKIPEDEANRFILATYGLVKPEELKFRQKEIKNENSSIEENEF